jgi:hypothetical protein
MLFLPLVNRRDEAAFLIRRERPQIECTLRVRHPRPVAGRAIRRIDTRALLDLLGRRNCSCAEATALCNMNAHPINTLLFHTIHSSPYQFGINAKVHTDPPSGTSGRPRRCEAVPPLPERIVTYCRPFRVQVTG